MNRTKVIIWLLALTIMAILMPRLFQKEVPDVALPMLEMRSDAILKHITYKRFERDALIVELVADQATLIKKEGVMETVNPRLIIRANSNRDKMASGQKSMAGGQPIKVRARRGRLNIKTLETKFFDAVVLETPDQGTLHTDVLSYTPKTHTLKSDVPVIIKRGGLEIKGSSLIYDTLTGKLLIKGSSTKIKGT